MARYLLKQRHLILKIFHSKIKAVIPEFFYRGSMDSRLKHAGMTQVIVIILSFFILFSCPFNLYAEPPIDHSKWDQILKRYVREGLVDYEALFQRREELDDYLMQIENVSVERLAELGREERIAFWVNLYNASVIKMILDVYPVKQVNEIPAFFDVHTIRTIGEFFSLTDLRDSVLRQGFRDERILCALTSGRMDSPKLFEEAFHGEKLEDQLNIVSRRFVEDGTRNWIKPGTKKILLSPLFRTFASDFILNYGGSTNANKPSKFSPEQAAVISFFLDHLYDSGRKLFLDSGRYKIDYLLEDPRLNDVKNQATK